MAKNNILVLLAFSMIIFYGLLILAHWPTSIPIKVLLYFYAYMAAYGLLMHCIKIKRLY
jgi:hypothetical protein